MKKPESLNRWNIEGDIYVDQADAVALAVNSLRNQRSGIREERPELCGWSPEEAKALDAALNEEYIYDFPELWTDEDSYESFFANRDRQREIIDSYLGNEPVNANNLAFKESLDHYVLREFRQRGKNFAESSTFEKYIDYIAEIAREKVSLIDDEEYHTEFATNPVLSNLALQEIIFGKGKDTIALHRQKTYSAINNIKNRIEEDKPCSQQMIDFMGEYIHLNKNATQEVRFRFLDYIYNRENSEMTIKMSERIASGLLDCYARSFSSNERVRNTRMFLTDFDFNDEPMLGARGMANMGKSFCIFSRKSFRRFLEASQLNGHYHLMFTGFHELSHRYQYYRSKDETMSNSGLCSVLDAIIRKYSEKDYDYDLSHDSYSSEVDADETSWIECAEFIGEILGNSKHGDRQNLLETRIGFYENYDTQRAFRAFAYRIDSDLKTRTSYDEYEVRELNEIIANNPGIVNRYPFLDRYYKGDGSLRDDILFQNNNPAGERNLANMMFTKFIVKNQATEQLDKLRVANLNSEQIENFLINISDLVCQNGKYIERVVYTPAELFSFRRVHFNFDEEKHILPKIYFEQCADQLSFARVAYKIIQERFSNYDHDFAESLMSRNQEAYNICRKIYLEAN